MNKQYLMKVYPAGWAVKFTETLRSVGMTH